MPAPKTPQEIAELTEQLTGQPARDNQAHAIWTQMWAQLDAIQSLLHLQTKYLELYLTEHLDYSVDDITEFLASGGPDQRE